MNGNYLCTQHPIEPKRLTTVQFGHVPPDRRLTTPGKAPQGPNRRSPKNPRHWHRDRNLGYRHCRRIPHGTGTGYRSQPEPTKMGASELVRWLSGLEAVCGADFSMFSRFEVDDAELEWLYKPVGQPAFIWSGSDC